MRKDPEDPVLDEYSVGEGWPKGGEAKETVSGKGGGVVRTDERAMEGMAPKEMKMEDDEEGEERDEEKEKMSDGDVEIEQQLEVLGKHGKELANAAEKEITAAFSMVSAKVSEGMGALEKQTQGVSKAFNSWWSTLDSFRDGIVEGQMEAEQGPEGEAVPDGALETLFGLEPSEKLLDAFQCVLLQNYKCVHNEWTPEKRVKFPGVLYVTEEHLCFNGGRLHSVQPKTPVLLHRSNLISAAMEEEAEATDAGGAGLRVQFKEDQYIMLVGLEQGREAEAMSLIQGLCENQP